MTVCSIYDKMDRPLKEKTLSGSIRGFSAANKTEGGQPVIRRVRIYCFRSFLNAKAICSNLQTPSW